MARVESTDDGLRAEMLATMSEEEAAAFMEAQLQDVEGVPPTPTEADPFVETEGPLYEEARAWVFRFLHAKPTTQQLQEFCVTIATIVNDRASPKSKVVLVFNLSSAERAGIRSVTHVLRKIRSFVDIYRERIEAVSQGVIVVIRNSLMETLVNGFLRVFGSKIPVRVTSRLLHVETLAHEMANP